MKIIDESDVPKYLAQKKQPLIFQNNPQSDHALRFMAELYELCQERLEQREAAEKTA